jgi:hypothetical protein
VESVAAGPSHPGNLSTTCVDGITECIFQWALLVSDCVVCASAKFANKKIGVIGLLKITDAHDRALLGRRAHLWVKLLEKN